MARPFVFNGAWRNGRRSGPLIRFLPRSVGSNPTAPTRQGQQGTVGPCLVARTQTASQGAKTWKGYADASPQTVLIATSTACLCDELAWLRSRYDTGAVAPAFYDVIKRIEIEIAWRRHARPLRTEEGV